MSRDDGASRSPVDDGPAEAASDVAAPDAAPPDADEERQALEAAVTGLQAQLDRTRRERDELAREADEAQRRLDAVYATRTWRVGRALLLPPYRAKQLMQRNPRLRTAARRLRGYDAAPGTATPIGTAAAALPIAEDGGLRSTYTAALERQSFSPGTGRVLMAVSSTDFSEGRGDLYTAVGLGRQLERLGYEVVYRAPDGWYDMPEHTDLVIAMIAERDHVMDPGLLPRRVRTLAWVRNQTRRWAALPTLPLYDAVAGSSAPTLQTLRRVHRGPHLLLPIAVDDELFHDRRPEDGAPVRADAVVTTINSWSRERELHRALASGDLGAPLAMYGRTDGIPAALRPHALGPVSFFALPSVYRAVPLVLDDLQDVNRRYGNLNSRVYEALACGALPISNARAGFAEAGLSDLPVATTAEELRATVARYRGDPGAREVLTSHLRGVVLARHTYAVRAATLHAFLQASLPAPRGGPTLAFAPDYRATNPYQSMLAAALADHGVRTVPATSPMALVRGGAVDPATLVHHQHWTATILGASTSSREAERACDAYLRELDELRDLGGRVIWTIHNGLPHECAFPAVERRLQQGIADRADVVHVMCEPTADLVADVVRLPPDRTQLLPHGSYVDVYPNVVDPQQARLELGLDPDDVVLLSLGGIRPYRGVDLLLDAFEEALRAEPRLRLVVAGRPGRHPSVDALRSRCRAHPRIVPYFEAVPDVDLQLFFKAADVGVFSHRSVLNSGGVLLSWSFGRPVIAPQAGCLTQQLAGGGGIGYLPDRPGALAEALRAAATLATPQARLEAHGRAMEYTHLDMARDYGRLVAGLLASSRTESR